MSEDGYTLYREDDDDLDTRADAAEYWLHLRQVEDERRAEHTSAPWPLSTNEEW